MVFGALTLHQSEWQKASTWNPALETLYHCQFTLSTQLIKPNDLVIPSTDAAPQFLEIRNFPPLFIINFFHLSCWVQQCRHKCRYKHKCNHNHKSSYFTVKTALMQVQAKSGGKKEKSLIFVHVLIFIFVSRLCPQSNKSCYAWVCACACACACACVSSHVSHCEQLTWFINTLEALSFEK